jgi:hypothetical protein
MHNYRNTRVCSAPTSVDTADYESLRADGGSPGEGIAVDMLMISLACVLVNLFKLCTFREQLSEVE